MTPISEADRVRDIVMANAGGIIEDIAEKAGCSKANIYKAAKDMGIEVVSKKHAAPISALPVMQNRVKYSLMHHAFNDHDPEGLKEELDIILGSDKPPVKHIKDSYNQSPSPFGLADKLRGIK